jgi:hypothetical protein
MVLQNACGVRLLFDELHAKARRAAKVTYEPRNDNRKNRYRSRGWVSPVGMRATTPECCIPRNGGRF